MNKIILSLFVALSSTALTANQAKTANTPTSTPTKITMTGQVKWTGWGIGKSHTGDLKIKDGFWEVKDGKPTSGSFTMDMTSISYENPKLANHLKSDDFFAVEKFPTASFSSTKIEEIKSAKTAEVNYMVSGNLSVKDKTAPVTFKMTWKNSAASVDLATASFEIPDRTQFGITYNSKRFFDIAKLGDKLIEDRIGIAFELKPVSATSSPTKSN
jgi:polyisoprenoid-binding protein YceI